MLERWLQRLGKVGQRSLVLKKNCERSEEYTHVVKERTGFDCTQTLQLPTLEGLERIFKTFLQTETLSVKSTHCKSIGLVRLLCLMPGPDMGSFTVLSGVESLADDIDERICALEQVLGLQSLYG